MNRVLFMTVGTGMGTDAKSKTLNLAHGLLASIEHYHPDFVIFFGSEESRVTIESLRAQYLVKQGQNITHYEFVPLTKIDEFDHCFTVIARKILERPNEEIIIDYTSGTKTMTMCAALASMLYHKKLTLISGTRGSNGAVTPGTEEIHEQNLYSAYDVELERHLCTLFNLNRFEEAEDILHKILSLDAAQRSFYDHLLAGYSSWDKFHHKDAYIHIKEIKPTQFAYFIYRYLKIIRQRSLANLQHRP